MLAPRILTVDGAGVALGPEEVEVTAIEVFVVVAGVAKVVLDEIAMVSSRPRIFPFSTQ